MDRANRGMGGKGSRLYANAQTLRSTVGLTTAFRWLLVGVVTRPRNSPIA
jgi:hypothetical protein